MSDPAFPPQQQDHQPGSEAAMTPRPRIEGKNYRVGIPQFGTGVPLGRAAQPEEIAPCDVFLASDDSSYMTGQVLHPNGGEVVNT